MPVLYHRLSEDHWSATMFAHECRRQVEELELVNVVVITDLTKPCITSGACLSVSVQSTCISPAHCIELMQLVISVEHIVVEVDYVFHFILHHRVVSQPKNSKNSKGREFPLTRGVDPSKVVPIPRSWSATRLA